MPTLQTEGKQTVLTQAGEWLLERLARGPVPTKQIYSDGALVGFRERTLDRAKAAMRIESKRLPQSTGWVWSTPAWTKGAKGATKSAKPEVDQGCQACGKGAKGANLGLQANRESNSDGTHPPWRQGLGLWPEDSRELWEERSAIMEYDGGLSRDEAERQAYAKLKATRARDAA